MEGPGSTNAIWRGSMASQPLFEPVRVSGVVGMKIIARNTMPTINSDKCHSFLLLREEVSNIGSHLNGQPPVEPNALHCFDLAV